MENIPKDKSYFHSLDKVGSGAIHILPMFEKARRNGRHGMPWLKARVSRHVMPKARHDVMCGFCNTVFNLTYIF